MSKCLFRHVSKASKSVFGRQIVSIQVAVQAAREFIQHCLAVCWWNPVAAAALWNFLVFGMAFCTSHLTMLAYRLLPFRVDIIMAATAGSQVIINGKWDRQWLVNRVTTGTASERLCFKVRLVAF